MESTTKKQMYGVNVTDPKTGHSWDAKIKALSCDDAFRQAHGAGWMVSGEAYIIRESPQKQHERAVFVGTLKAGIVLFVALNVLWLIVWAGMSLV